MKTNILRKLFITAGFLVAFAVGAATISRVKTFSDGEILTASDLNAEFDNVVDGVNSITNDNVASNAAISPAKISSAIKGSAISRNSTSGALSVSVDDSTIEVNSDALRLKDAGITGAKLNSTIVDNSTIQLSSNQLSIKNSGVGTSQIADAAVTQAKRASLNIQTSSSSGVFFVTDSSTTFADITNLSVTITTTGRPVWIGLASAGTIDTSVGNCNFIASTNDWIVGLDRSSSNIAFWRVRDILPCSGFNFIDAPSAGTYTYKIQHRAFSATSTLRSANNMKLIAYEL